MRISRAPHRTFARAVTPLLAAGLLLSACGGDDDPEPKADDGASAAPSEPDHWPLTGVALPDGESAAKSHPVYVVKVENTDGGAPQVGLSQSDLVVEELVEGNLTRLAAFYYENLPREVEAVRSMRPSDAGIVAPVDGTIVTSGAAGFTKETLDEAGVSYIEEGADGFSRDDSRPAPYNVIADLKTISKSAEGEDARPDDYFTWSDAEKFPAGKKAKNFTADFGGHASQWSYDGKGYVLENGHMPEDDAFTPDTVAVLKVRTSLAPYKDPGGADVPISHFEGKGNAWVFHDGRMVKATWEKSAEDAPVSFSLADGTELAVPVGKVWLELLPKNAGQVSLGQ
ncbi:DUF3048 domain-containing protein [Nocardioides insulae]|uniref:DUF3048 domain-containing protein n=1 Tax=Nocardioides insulae TaxID=394734 RepID=UPI00048E8131|nr:DUF3048 domain-containing protein [Nocardioides insulae]